MTKDETKAAIAVMQAWVDGKPLQTRARDQGQEWQDAHQEFAGWNWAHWEYRIKPEPREWWMREHGKGQPCTSCGLFTSHADASSPAADDQKTTRIIKVREVLE